MREYRDKGYTHLNHGDCVGADALAHDFAIELGLKVIVHPPLIQRVVHIVMAITSSFLLKENIKCVINRSSKVGMYC